MAEQTVSFDHREMARKANDLIRVYNPTDDNFTITWDTTSRFVVPAKDTDMGDGKGQRVLPRYIALRYVTKMTDQQLTMTADDAVRKENERRIKAGQQVMTPWEEQPKFETAFKINRPELREDLFQKLWLGTEREFGLDERPVTPEYNSRDMRTEDEKLMAKFDRPVNRTTNAVLQEDTIESKPAVPVLNEYSDDTSFQGTGNSFSTATAKPDAKKKALEEVAE